MVISSQLTNDQKGKLLTDLKRHKIVFGWILKDIKHINPLICTHRMHLKENVVATRQPKKK